MNFAQSKRLIMVAICFLLALSSIAASSLNNVTPIEREYKQIMADRRKALEALRNDLENKDQTTQQAAYKKYQALEKQIADKMLALGKKNPKDPWSVDALTMVLWNARGTDEAKQALELLKRNYLQSPHITGLCFYLEHDRKEGREVLKHIAESNPDANAKAAALLFLGRMLKDSDPAQAEIYFKQVAAEFPDTQYEVWGRKVRFGDEATAEIFDVEHLRVGKQAPEITGEDVDGKKFSLSDYRGKVVLLDFWGDW